MEQLSVVLEKINIGIGNTKNTLFYGITTEDELRKVYYDYSKMVHPDISGLDVSIFQKLKTSYETYLSKLNGYNSTSSSHIAIPTSNGAYIMTDKIAEGDFSVIYSGYFESASDRKKSNAVFKIALEGCNVILNNEAKKLKNIYKNPDSDDYKNFIPRFDALFQADVFGDGVKSQIAVYGYADNIAAKDLLSLTDVISQYPVGIDPRDMAWIWRRILHILGFVHHMNIVHGGLIPEHILIEPDKHGVILSGWSSAITLGTKLKVMPSNSLMYNKVNKDNFSIGDDLYLAAQSMVALVGGIDKLPRSLKHHFTRLTPNTSYDSWRALHEFDILIEQEWGVRKFRVFPPVKRVDTLGL